MLDGELHYLELVSLARLVQTGQLSPVEVTRALLSRIAELDVRLGSYVTVTAGRALSEARAAEREIGRGHIRGALHGVPIALKDVIDVAGVATAAGMPMFADRIAARDATITVRLRQAGAILLGKTQLTEGAYGQYPPPFTAPVNPWHPGYWPGASSSGSGVAVAAGLCFAALGTDTGGSIRAPSAVNGLTGIRPTWGRVSRHGVAPLAATLDQAGPMARSAVDAAALLGVIAGHDPADPASALDAVPDYLAGLGREVGGLRVGIDPGYALGRVDPAAGAAVQAALTVFGELGAEVRELVIPDLDQAAADWLGVCSVQAALTHEGSYPARRAEYGARLGALLERGRAMTAVNYERLLQRRAEFRGRMEAVLAGVDVLILPVLPRAAPRTDELDDQAVRDLRRFTAPFAMSGHPALVMPAGFTAPGLPVAVQLVARHFGEPTLIRAAGAFQRATGWHRCHPALG
ncbi:MAG TPA: amidase [Streptosporangiaceae bacterium]